MPMKPPRPCKYPGCRELTRDSYCARHKPKGGEDRSKEAQSWRWMYRTKRWTDELRPAQLLKEPWCIECARRGKRVRATDVDHVKDHKGDWAVFSDPGNLRSLCHSCHSRKTAKDLWKSRAKIGRP